MNLTPPTLRGRYVTLEPLARRHAADLLPIMRDEEVHRYMTFAPPSTLADVESYIREAEASMAAGQSIVFAQIDNATGKAVGSTRLLDVRPADRQVEIGGTFIARECFRTPINTEAKLLFLGHCFEGIGCVRVALKTDGRNQRSQQAILRLGAVYEGTLRKHMNVRGYQRDTVYYSILEDEWPTVRGRLEQRLLRNP